MLRLVRYSAIVLSIFVKRARTKFVLMEWVGMILLLWLLAKEEGGIDEIQYKTNITESTLAIIMCKTVIST